MTYEYVCEKCGHKWEESQSIKEEPTKTCPKCQEESAKRLISKGSGFILQGTCWANNGYSR